MRRRLAEAVFLGSLLLVMAARPAHALENEEKDAQQAEADRSVWKPINTAIFFIGIGYLIFKTAPKFFNARSSDIQKAIEEATGLKMNADLRHSEIDRKMAGLAEQVRAMREAARAEMDREHQRIQRQTREEIVRLQQHTDAEIESERLAGERAVRQKTAQAAIDRAEERLRQRLSGGESDDLVRDFATIVERGKN